MTAETTNENTESGAADPQAEDNKLVESSDGEGKENSAAPANNKEDLENSQESEKKDLEKDEVTEYRVKDF